MKKAISMVLVLMMLLVGIVSAQAATGDATLIAPAEGDQQIDITLDSIASDGERLYAVYCNQVLTCTKDDPTMQPYVSGITTSRRLYRQENPDMDHIIAQIYIYQGELLCLDESQGALFTLSADAEGKPVYGEVHLIEMEEGLAEEVDGRRQMTNFQFENSVVVGDTLLVSGYNWENGSGRKELYKIDLDTYEMEKSEAVEELEVLSPYKDGKALIMNPDYNNMYDEETQSYKPWPLSVYDPATDTAEVLYSVNIKGLDYYQVRAFVYDPASDHIYIVAENRIYLANDQQGAELVAYHPSTSLYSLGNPALNLGGKIVVADTNARALYLRNPDPAQLPKHTLAVSGYYDTDEGKMAAAKMGDVPVFYTNDWFNTAQELGQALAAGENQIDLMCVSLSWMDFDRLASKGYCYDLSGSSKLMEFMNKLYPCIRDSVMYDGKLMAIPVEAYCNDMWSYNAKALEELGYQVPTTYAEMVAIMNDFAKEENSDKWEEYCLFNDEGSIKQMMMYRAMSDYEQYMISTGKTMSLDTPEFRALMQTLEELDVENVEVVDGWSDDGEPSEEMEALWNKTALFSSYYQISPYNYQGNDYQPIRVVIGEDAGFQIQMDMRVLFVNPRSANLDEAVRYLEYLAESYNQERMTEWSPEYNDPIENPYYERNLKQMEKELANMEKAIAEAEPIDRQALQENYDSYKEYMEEYTRENRFNLTEESIAAYRELAQYMVVSQPSVMYSQTDDDSFYTLRTRYFDGQISLEQFIMEGSSKLRLMQMENQ